jgi:hypothetical protein
MTAICIALALVVVVAITALTAITLRSRLSPGPSLTDRTVVVHTRDDKSIRGLLFAQYADRLTLRKAIFLHSSGEQAAGGLVHVPIASVSWLQEIE